MEFYFRNIARRWKKESCNADAQIRILSPYVTSNIAESVVLQPDGGVCEIYTVFESELFATGASSLRTLKKLFNEGHLLFHLPNLHAKVLVSPGRFASVGSQNLTSRGTQNKEASIAIIAPLSVEKVQLLINPWIEEAVPIDAEMIQEMERLLPLLKRRFRELQQAAKSLDEGIFADREQRAAAALKHHQWLAELKQSIAVAPKSQERVRARVTESHDYDRRSLKASSSGRFTRWLVGGMPLKLVPTNRYLCILEESGKIGWARVMETVITFVGSAVSRLSDVAVAGVAIRMEFQSDWDEVPHKGRNLSIVLKKDKTPLCIVSAGFGLSTLTILDCQLGQKAEGNGLAKGLMTWILANESKFCEIVLPEITRPFKYISNLHGVQAHEFFGEVDTQYSLRVITNHDQPVLVASRL